MKRYSVLLWKWTFVKGYVFLCFVKKNGKNIIKKFSEKYSQKLFDHAKQSASDTFKTASKREIQETADTTGDLTGNEITDRVTKVSKNWPNNNSEANEEEILRKRYISPAKRQKIIDGLRLIQ